MIFFQGQALLLHQLCQSPEPPAVTGSTWPFSNQRKAISGRAMSPNLQYPITMKLSIKMVMPPPGQMAPSAKMLKPIGRLRIGRIPHKVIMSAIPAEIFILTLDITMI